MAEAVVEERPPMPLRYYCHRCNTEINIPNTDYTCPLCAGGFVEELPSAQQNNAPGTMGSGSGGASTSRGNPYAHINALRGELTTLLRSRNAPFIELSADPLLRPRAVSTGTNTGTNTSGTGSTTNIGGGRVRPQNVDRLDNVLFEFLQSLSSNDTTGHAFGNQMFFLGNFGDYAWGREGIDTIVTQLLNQMETSGPPPLSKEKIDDIPKVEITQEDVDKKLQCSVCWEDFQLKEVVRKLACSHVYHENCIVPWLELHSTCPICRKELNGDGGGGEATSGSERTTGENEPLLFSNRRNMDSSGSSGGGNNNAGRGSSGGPSGHMQHNSTLDDLD